MSDPTPTPSQSQTPRSPNQNAQNPECPSNRETATLPTLSRRAVDHGYQVGIPTISINDAIQPEYRYVFDQDQRNRHALPDTLLDQPTQLTRRSRSSETVRNARPVPLPPANSRITRPHSRRHIPNVTRGSVFSQREVDALLETIRRHLPLCREEWNVVLLEHNRQFESMSRTVDSLKRKFSGLQRKRMPTGDPLMPVDVRVAKLLRHRMTERADLGMADEAERELEPYLPTAVAVNDKTEDHLSSPMSSADEGPAAPVTGAQVFSTSPSPFTLSPRPIVHTRRGTRTRGEDTAEVFALIKAGMLQEQQRREAEETGRREDAHLRFMCIEEDRQRRKEEHERRVQLLEEEGKRREKKRKDEMQRREEDYRRHERFMELFLVALTGQSPHRNAGTTEKDFNAGA